MNPSREELLFQLTQAKPAKERPAWLDIQELRDAFREAQPKVLALANPELD